MPSCQKEKRALLRENVFPIFFHFNGNFSTPALPECNHIQIVWFFICHDIQFLLCVFSDFLVEYGNKVESTTQLERPDN
jgi:hypothetical protein